VSISNTTADNNVSASCVVDNPLEAILRGTGYDSLSTTKTLLFMPSGRYLPQLVWLLTGSCLILALTLLSLNRVVLEPTPYRNLLDEVSNATLGVR
jgi:hypothetical protein